MFRQRQRSRRNRGEIGVGENAAVVAFSCSSKRTISPRQRAVIDTLQFVEAPVGSPSLHARSCSWY